MADKESLRKIILNILKSLPEKQIQSLSFKLTHQLVKFFSTFPDLTDQVGGTFFPLKTEIAPVYQELLREVPLVLSFPVLEDGQMSFGLSQGIPKGNLWLELPYLRVNPDWLMVPGVGFDFEGRRLGRGKGFYDRYLENKDVLTIGLCWSEQIVKKIPVEQHDCLMDFIITEEFCWNVDQQIKF